MTSIDASVQSIHNAFARVDSVAQRVASLADPASADSVDLSAEMVSLIEAKNQVAVSVKTFQAVTDMQSNLLDILA